LLCWKRHVIFVTIMF